MEMCWIGHWAGMAMVGGYVGWFERVQVDEVIREVVGLGGR
jgi:hypothetical protein